MSQGTFITFEGPDGSGKTTQLRLLSEALTAKGHQIVTLRQPGSTHLGDKVRGILLDSRSDTASGGIAPLAELALMFADRAQAIADIIRPALDGGAIVLCDRYTDSSEAYQGAGRQLGQETVLALHQVLCAGLQPDLTILLLPPLAASLHRARKRNQAHAAAYGTDENRFEREDEDFYMRVQAGYEAIAMREPERIVVFREQPPIAALAGQILATVLSRMPGAR